MAKLGKIARASMLLMIGSVLSKILGFARELLVAYLFGATSISDAFVLTNSIPTLIFVALATAININFIPFYHRIETEDGKNKFTSNLVNLSIVAMLIGCLLVNAFPRLVLKVFALGLPQDTENYSVLMLRIVIFSIIPIILSYIFQALLQANEKFVSTALFGIVSNIAIIVFTFIAKEETYYLLSVGTIAANALGLIPIMIEVKKKTSYQYKPYMNIKDDQIKDLVLLTAPLLVESLASSLSLIVDRNLASFLDEGTISGLGYAGTIGNVAVTMIATAIMTATFPAFSKMLAKGEKEEFANQFERYASVISYLLAPISVFMIVEAFDIVELIYEHGAFDSVATVIVAQSMICYSVGAVPNGVQWYLIRGFYAMQDTKTPVIIKVVSLVINIVLNIISVRFIAHMGIALSTSISYLVAYLALAICLKKKYKINTVDRILFESLISVVLSAVAGVAVFFLFGRLIELPNLYMKLPVALLTFGVLYLGMIIVFRKSKWNDILSVIKRKGE